MTVQFIWDFNHTLWFETSLLVKLWLILLFHILWLYLALATDARFSEGNNLFCLWCQIYVAKTVDLIYLIIWFATYRCGRDNAMCPPNLFPFPVLGHSVGLHFPVSFAAVLDPCNWVLVKWPWIETKEATMKPGPYKHPGQSLPWLSFWYWLWWSWLSWQNYRMKAAGAITPPE